ncbi:MAG TPA: hypothetical protein VFA10_14465 [Ktedonobacteraceae bacterium]|nr:hypothetical protein [Ktedonobacteraceae bacterium]
MTCCKCDADADPAMTSPSGFVYCREHGKCIRCKGTKWKQRDDGMWLCTCWWTWYRPQEKTQQLELLTI